MTRHLFYPVVALTAALAACATAPPPNSALEQARQRVKSAQADSRVVSLAPLELKRAEQALLLAEKTWAADGSPAVVDHQAYMAGQRVTLAQETAASLADQAVTASAAAERDRMRLASRTAEADTAQRRLSESERSNAQKSSEIVAAQAKSDRDMATARAQSDRNLAAAQAQSDRNQQEAQAQQARVDSLESLLAELSAKKTERGVVVTLGDVLFQSGRSDLNAGADRQMAKLADALRRDPGQRASIEGFTDSVGSDESNRELSGRRANAVMKALIDLGVPAQTLRTASRGEDAPVASNDTAQGRQMNRRVEIVISQARP